MRPGHVATSARLTALELARNRVAVGLSLLVPALFFATVFATTTDGAVRVRLAAAAQDLIEVPARRQSLVFISIAAAGLISAFFAANLVQRRMGADRRLILCGYRPTELLAAKLIVLAAIITVTTLYTWGLLVPLTSPPFPPGVPAGIALGAFVYGCYGLLVGAIFRRDIEAVFAILILVNIDAGWLQNPIYYAAARNKAFVEALPGHWASQASYLSAFTERPTATLLLASAGYGLAFLAPALAVYAVRVRVRRWS